MTEEGLRLFQDWPRPEPGPDDVVIEVRACALNRADVFMVEGLSGPGLRPRTLPRIGGVDIAGVVVEAGDRVTDFKPGDPVVVYPGVFCGECFYCRAGEQTMCDHYGIIGEEFDGGLAEYTRIPRRNLMRMPEGFDFITAAAAPATFGTVWRGLFNRAGLRAGHDLLVLGASGGVGTAAVILGKHAGARVLAVASGQEKLRRLRELGADLTADYRQVGDIAAWAREQTGGRGVDVVFDPLGAETWRQSINSLKMGGKMVICGATTGDRPDISIREIYQNHRQILGAPMGNLEDTEHVLSLVWSGAVAPAIHRVLPLDDALEAFEIMRRRDFVGKVVVVP